jgi:DMSO/TMAO reductase YedYZ molybdopterin-dependent catalytic subunit
MSRPTLDPASYFRRIPLAPQQMNDRLTSTQDAIVLCHLGVPHLDRDRWTLIVDGLVEHPLTLSFADLVRFPKVTLTSIHQCAGSPLQPFEPTRRICNLTWGGVRVADIFAACRPLPSASYLWSYGADFGEFSGVEVDAYLKDLPIARVASDVLIAYEINGAPLPPMHGFPVRLVVPGFYGTNSVKWLTRMTLARERANGPFTTRWYNDAILDVAGQETAETSPVWSIAPESIIVSPAPGDNIDVFAQTRLWGWAWADGGIESVDVSFDAGTTWLSAEVEAPQGRQWQRFARMWQPDTIGQVTLCARARSFLGAHQPLTRGRNSVQRVEVTVQAAPSSA